MQPSHSRSRTCLVHTFCHRQRGKARTDEAAKPHAHSRIWMCKELSEVAVNICAVDELIVPSHDLVPCSCDAGHLAQHEQGLDQDLLRIALPQQLLEERP